MKKPLFLGTLTLALLTGAAGVRAHDEAYLDTLHAPNGGQLRMAGIYHLELVVDTTAPQTREKPIRVHVTDHAGQKVPTAAATGTVTILAAKSKTTIALVPDGDNRLKGTGRYASTPDMKAVVSITPQGQPPETARFTPLAKPRQGHAGHGMH